MYPYKFEYYRFQLVPKKVVQLSIDNVAYTIMKSRIHPIPISYYPLYLQH